MGERRCKTMVLSKDSNLYFINTFFIVSAVEEFIKCDRGTDTSAHEAFLFFLEPCVDICNKNCLV